MTGIGNALLDQSFAWPNIVHHNLSEAKLIELAIAREEAHLSKDGALVALTGQHTGRSASDKYVVKDGATEPLVWWEGNKALAPEAFGRLLDDMLEFSDGKDLFAQDLWGGADPVHRLPVRIITEYAWHSLFIRHLLIRPDVEALQTFEPAFTVVDLPSFKAEPSRHGCTTSTIIAVDFTRRLYRAKPSRKSMPPPNASAPCSKT